ncbi:MAG: enoyl-CoA hydratase/isomerase family protein [Sphingopyxis sp.]|nr:enoyl-CoA hydratase/isomerase family protein [Sphingopyxis sp.]
MTGDDKFDGHARIDVEDRIITVTMTRPDKLNAISPAITAAFWEATRRLADDDSLGCMIIAATGRYFTAGIDLKASAKQRTDESDAMSSRPGWQYRRAYREHHLLYDEFENLEKPIVLAAQGTCLGAGLEMAMSCDFRFCTPTAEWAVPEIRLGVLPGSGGASRLARIVGPAWAKYLAMAGRQIDAEKALRIGLIHDIFPAETFAEDVRTFCLDLCELPAEAVGMTKTAIDIAADIADRSIQRQVDRLVNTILVHSDEHKEALNRYR